MSRVVVAVAPAPVLSLADAKAHLRVAGNGDDDMIEALVAAATNQIDGPAGWLGRAIGAQTLELLRDDFPCAAGWIALPCPPVVALVSVTYEDADGIDRTIPLDSLRLRGGTLALAAGASWPSTSGAIENVRIRYTAGYTAPPPAILAALKLMTGTLYSFARPDPQLKKEVVEGVGSQEFDLSGSFDLATNRAVDSLLAPFRVWSV